MTALFGIQQFQIGSSNFRFEKVARDKDFSYNLINYDVIFDKDSKVAMHQYRADEFTFRKNIFNELIETSLKDCYDFQRKAQRLEENKKILKKRNDAFAQKIKNFEPFVEENNYRYKRTCEFSKEDSRVSDIKSLELEGIRKEISGLYSRKLFFLQANKQLKKYEVFLLETLGLLPADYVKGLKENNMKALLRRCDALFLMNRATYNDLYKSSIEIRDLKHQLDLSFSGLSEIQTEQSLIFPRLQNRALRCHEELTNNIIDYNDAYATLRHKMHTFGLLLQAVNNITNKCFEMITKSFFGFRDLSVLPRITMMDPNLKFHMIEEYISSSLLMLELLKNPRLDRTSDDDSRRPRR